MSETFTFGFEEADPEDLPRRRPSRNEDTFVGRDAAAKGIASGGWAWAYLAALALPAVLSGIAFFTARALFRPSARLG
ncbi:hypothetical protein ACQPW3_10435 [Actinosynnema sp. CA-248983]